MGIVDKTIEFVPPLHFRTATVDDVPVLVELVTSAYRGEVSRRGWTTEADLLDGNRIDPDALRHDVLRPHSQVLIAERNGNMQACAHICEQDDAGYFGMFSVKPDLQSSGVGTAVLVEAERIVRDEWQLPRMRMNVIDVREDIIGWYKRRGYRRTGIIKPFPYGDTRFGLPKRDDLRFEVLEKIL